MIKPLFFHATASEVQGSGHVMRMYALAEEAKSRDIRTIFLGRVSNIAWITKDFLSKVFDEVIDIDDNPPIRVEDSILIWDSYLLEGPTSRVLDLPFSKKFLIADAVTPIHSADGIFLLEESSVWSDYLSKAGIPHLEGRTLIPIRKSHQLGAKLKPSLDSPALTILIFSGGVDFNSFITPIAEFLIENYPSSRILTISKSDLTLDNNRVTQLKATSEFDFILDQADLVITSASTSLFEILSRRIPSGFVMTALNQESNREFLLRENLSIEVGRFEDAVFQLDEKALNLLIGNYAVRRSLQNNSLRAIPGLGSSKIIDYIIKNG